MKYYIVNNKAKKSVHETEVFEDTQGNRVLVTTIWRAGTFKVSVPETVEEYALAGYEPEDIEDACWPTEDDDAVDLSDFYEYELLSTWDGCGDDYEFVFENDELLDQVSDIVLEEGISAFFDNELLEDFESSDCWYTIYNGITMEECDEEGNLLT